MGIAKEIETALTNILAKYDKDDPKPKGIVGAENQESWKGEAQTAIPNEPVPIPVVMLNEKEKFQRVLIEPSLSWTSQRFNLMSGVPQMVAGRNPLRTQVQLWNQSIGVIHFDTSQSVSLDSGQLFPQLFATNPGVFYPNQGCPLILTTIGEIWALSEYDNSLLSVFQTFQMGS